MRTTITSKTLQGILCPVVIILSISSYSQTTGYSGTGRNIDVNYYRCQWTIDPGAAKNIAGNVTIYFKTTQANTSTITLDLNKTSFNNSFLSVYYHTSNSNVSFSFPSTGAVNILTIQIPNVPVTGTPDSITINYSGVPPAVDRQAEGYQVKTVGTQKLLYTLSESYEDRDWWPCKADMQDKADSLDIIITSPSPYLGAANGVLVSNTVSGSNRTMVYKHRYPIASYLVAVAVAPYRDFVRGNVTISGTDVPVNYYILSGHSVSKSMLETMDYCKQELTAFSNKFGDYPFKNEKYGMYEFAWSGGMEHQSFSAMSWSSMSDWSIIAHELMHQWFGDKVTFATWNDLWLAEGFAVYGEVLAAELVPGLKQSASDRLHDIKYAATGSSESAFGCYIPASNITNSNTLWTSAYGKTVYDRGCMVVSMLRTLLGDTKFFQACQNYLNDPLLAYKSATTADLQKHMQNVAGGYDLTPFFNSYVYGNYYPTYNIDWAPAGTKKIAFRINKQTKNSESNVSYYYTPIAIRVKGSSSTQDTVLVIYDQKDSVSQAGNGISAAIKGNILSFNLKFNPASVSFDPFSQTLASGTLNQIITLPVKLADFTLHENAGSNNLELSVYNDNNELQEIVLQKSDDGIQFSDAGVMTKESANASLINFVFKDNNPGTGNTYYRAKVNSISGEKISKILRACNHEIRYGSISPNPADKQFTVKWSNRLCGKKYIISLIGIDGQVVWKGNTNINWTTIQTEKLPVGIYLVQVTQENKNILNEKLIINR